MLTITPNSVSRSARTKARQIGNESCPTTIRSATCGLAVVACDGIATREPLPFDDSRGRERGGIRHGHAKRELGLFFIQRKALDDRNGLALRRPHIVEIRPIDERGRDGEVTPFPATHRVAEPELRSPGGGSARFM